MPTSLYTCFSRCDTTRPDKPTYLAHVQYVPGSEDGPATFQLSVAVPAGTPFGGLPAKQHAHAHFVAEWPATELTEHTLALLHNQHLPLPLLHALKKRADKQNTDRAKYQQTALQQLIDAQPK
jgi:hypothetical protein